MTKRFLFIVSSLFLCFFAGCSQSTDRQAVLTFFDALQSTLQKESFTIEGDGYQLKVNQKGDLQAALTTEDAQFYIDDGKTYLNWYGTKSQSVLENLGIQKDAKLSQINPFLDMTDDELADMFSSASQKGDVITMEVNPDSLANLLDTMGGATVKKAAITATIENGTIKNLKIDFSASQTMDDATSDINLNLDLSIKDVGSTTIDFPDFTDYSN